MTVLGDTPSNVRADPFISVSDVELTYKSVGGDQTTALHNLSFTVQENEFISFIGPSGCGKTTLLRVLGDLLPPSSGSVLIAGEAPSTFRSERKIGTIFQQSVLLPWKTISENIGFLAKVSRRAVPQGRIEELARLVGIGESLSKLPHELSGGMQQRASIARALALDPALLLMDEPFGALDEITRGRMNLELQRIWSNEQKTVIFITHSISEAAFLSDRVFVMGTEPGRIIAEERIDLPRPRTEEMKYGAHMNERVSRLHEHLRGAEANTGSPRKRSA